MLPFGHDAFFSVFAAYNAAIWPAQILAEALGLLAVGLALARHRGSELAVRLVLAALWIVNGIGYHLLFFSRINTLAYVFAAAFVGQAVILMRQPIRFTDAAPATPIGIARIAGLVLVAYALVAYPLIGLLAAHPYPATPLFGVAPCPTTIFTLGMLAMSAGDLSWRVLAIPLLWSVIGGSAAVLLAVPQDYGLILAGAVALALKLTGQHAPANVR